MKMPVIKLKDIQARRSFMDALYEWGYSLHNETTAVAAWNYLIMCVGENDTSYVYWGPTADKTIHISSFFSPTDGSQILVNSPAQVFAYLKRHENPNH